MNHSIKEPWTIVVEKDAPSDPTTDVPPGESRPFPSVVAMSWDEALASVETGTLRGEVHQLRHQVARLEALVTPPSKKPAEVIGLRPNPTEASQKKPGDRWISCPEYDGCLDRCVGRGWTLFTCTKCGLYAAKETPISGVGIAATMERRTKK